MAQINNMKKPPRFDGSNYGYWKVKMTAHIKSISRKVWLVVDKKFEVANEEVEVRKLSSVGSVYYQQIVVYLSCHYLSLCDIFKSRSVECRVP